MERRKRQSTPTHPHRPLSFESMPKDNEGKREYAQKALDRLKIWREENKAPVDTMGAAAFLHAGSSDPNERAFQLLVSVLLSVQSQDAVTDRTMRILLKEGIGIDKYAHMDVSRLQALISGINFYQKKAEYIIKCAQYIVDKCKGRVPDSVEGLTKLPGVGNKVANLVLQIGFDKSEAIAVDTHVHRITNRLGWVDTLTPDQTMTSLSSLFPPAQYKDINHLFVGLGQLVCKASNPKCVQCPLVDYCEYAHSHTPGGKRARSPQKKERKKSIPTPPAPPLAKIPIKSLLSKPNHH